LTNKRKLGKSSQNPQTNKNQKAKEGEGQGRRQSSMQKEEGEKLFIGGSSVGTKTSQSRHLVEKCDVSVKQKFKAENQTGHHSSPGKEKDNGKQSRTHHPPRRGKNSGKQS